MAGTEDLGPDDRRAVLLDFDGTLYELAQDLRAFRARWGEGPVITILERLSKADRTAALADLTQVDLDGVQHGRPLVSADVLRRVQARYPVAVVSRNAEPALQGGLARLGVEGVVVVGRESVTNHKPNPEPVLVALQRLGAETGVLVGDTSHDVEAARAAGITSVVVRNPKLAYQPNGADYYLEAMSGLPDLLEELWARPI